ncbi:MAG: hypothetical protein ACJ75H_13970 [Thermoanaerobaculia bacterium]
MEMETRDLDRIRFVTRHFNDLQGLRHWVPLGLITLGLGGVPFRPVLFAAAVLLVLGARRYYRKTLGEVEPQPAFPAGDFPSLSLYSPAGSMPPLEASRLMPPGARRFLISLGMALGLFTVFQVVNPNIRIVGHGSTLDSLFEASPAWTRGIGAVLSGAPLPTSPQILFTQLILIAFGALFLTLWLWRERRPSHGYELAFGAILLGLAAFGSFLGYFVYEDREIPRRIIDFFLPVLVRPEAALLLCGAMVIVAGLFDHWQLVRVLRRR